MLFVRVSVAVPAWGAVRLPPLMSPSDLRAAPPCICCGRRTAAQAAKGVFGKLTQAADSRAGYLGVLRRPRKRPKAGGHGAKRPGIPLPHTHVQARFSMDTLRAECSRACATGSRSSCLSASPASGRCACGFRAAGSRHRHSRVRWPQTGWQSGLCIRLPWL